jgi:16S rRNA (guanine(966)-N(2))-methyltransferase RsmD
VDAYAGTGAVGIEALSRGAARAYFLERNRGALDVLRENVEQLALGSRAIVVPGPVLQTISRNPADIVFLDPPYDLAREYTAAFEALAEAPPQLVVVQHSVRFEPGERHGALHRTRTVRQGDNVLSFYAPAAPPAGY